MDKGLVKGLTHVLAEGSEHTEVASGTSDTAKREAQTHALVHEEGAQACRNDRDRVQRDDGVVIPYFPWILAPRKFLRCDGVNVKKQR